MTCSRSHSKIMAEIALELWMWEVGRFLFGWVFFDNYQQEGRNFVRGFQHGENM